MEHFYKNILTIRTYVWYNYFVKGGIYLKKELVQTSINVNNTTVRVMRVRGIDYISLTDLARYKNSNNPGDVIIKWMSNKSSFDFY